jgi:hypothetical protein
MLYKRLITMLPWVGVVFVGGIIFHAIISNLAEAKQWPRRLARFVFAILAGCVIFGVIYIGGGQLVSTLGYTYNDKPLLRLAHLVCLIGAYPAALAAASIFRTRHAALLLGITLTLGVHLWDHGTYLGRMVFDDPAHPLNGDFALTNMALMLIGSILGGEAGLRVTLPGIYKRASCETTETGAPDSPSLTSGGG